MVQIAATDEPAIDRKELFSPCPSGRIGFPYKAIDIQIIRILLDRDQFAVIGAAEDLNDALFETSFLQMHGLLSVGRKRKEDGRKGERYPGEFVDDMPHFGRIAFEKISAGRNVEEKIFHCETG